MISQSRAGFLVLVAVAGLLAACGEAATSDALSLAPAATPETSPARPTQGRATACTGDVAGDARLSRLAARDRVVAGLVCRIEQRHLPGAGEWTVRIEARPTGRLLAALRTAYARPDAPPPSPGASCAAIGYVAPDVQFDLADGTTMHAAMPGGGCGAPPPDLLPAVGAALTAPGVRIVRLRQTRSEAAVAANCESEWKDVLTGIGAQHGSGTALPAPSGAGQMSVCRYRATGDGGLMLVAVGRTTPEVLREALAAVRRGTAPGSCPAHVAGALTVGDGGKQLFSVETGGCGRVVDAEFRSAGCMPSREVDRLASAAQTSSP